MTDETTPETTPETSVAGPSATESVETEMIAMIPAEAPEIMTDAAYEEFEALGAEDPFPLIDPEDIREVWGAWETVEHPEGWTWDGAADAYLVSVATEHRASTMLAAPLQGTGVEFDPASISSAVVLGMLQARAEEVAEASGQDQAGLLWCYEVGSDGQVRELTGLSRFPR